MFIMVGCLALWGACSSANPTGTIVSVEIEPERSTPDTVLLADREIIVLETHPEALLSGIESIDIDQDKLYVLDLRRDKLAVFDREGNFLSTIGRRGRGPGEFSNVITDFCIDRENDEILIATDRPNRIMRFSLSGEFFGQIPLPEEDTLFEIIKEGDNIYARIFAEKHEVAIYEMDGHAVGSVKYPEIQSLKTNYNDGVVTTPFGRMLTASKYGILFTRVFDNTIYRLENNELIPFRTIDFGKYYLEEARTFSSEEIRGLSMRKIIYSITNARLMGEDRIIFNGYPNGIFTVDGDAARQYGYLSHDLFPAEHMDMIPISDPESDYIAFSRPAVNIFPYYQFIMTTDSLAQFTGDRLRLSRLKEDDNPVLFLYKLK